MTSMNMDQFDSTYNRSKESSGTSFGDVEKLVVKNGLTVRLIGGMASTFEHFVDTAKGIRPVYCDGPEGDCSVCQLVASWAMSDDVTLQEKAKDMRAKERFYFNALDRSDQGRAYHAEKKHSYILSQNDKGLNVGPMILQAVGAVCQMRKEQGKPNDPNGFDLMLQKSGASMQTRYGANFTGDETPLTEEEAAYELYDLSTFTASTPAADVDAIVAYLNGVPAPAGDTTQQPQDAASTARSAIGQQSISAPPPSTTPPPAIAPVASAPAPVASAPAPVASAPAPVVVAPVTPTPVPKVQQQYADTAPTADFDAKTGYQIPCGECGVMMQISHSDHRNLKCHGCGKEYASPNQDIPF